MKIKIKKIKSKMEGDKTPPIKYPCKYCGEVSNEIFCKLAHEILYREDKLTENQFKK